MQQRSCKVGGSDACTLYPRESAGTIRSHHQRRPLSSANSSACLYLPVTQFETNQMEHATCARFLTEGKPITKRYLLEKDHGRCVYERSSSITSKLIRDKNSSTSRRHLSRYSVCNLTEREMWTTDSDRWLGQFKILTPRGVGSPRPGDLRRFASWKLQA